ncbi:glycosyl transferase [Brevibacillus sp. TJ4]|uniref:glycosyl transferase n=1 Tax=Brevibacillus sp. TJ4 TaxID=3234853 RepID=UPI003B9E6D97
MRTSRPAFNHIRLLTDDTGIVEHAMGRIPRWREGYSTDDQARALWMCLEWLDLVEEEESESLYALIDRYLSFLLWVQKNDGHFHNNVAFNRTWEPESPSDDCLGRCLWACSLALTQLPDDDRRIAAQTILQKALPQAVKMRYPRGWAYAIAACSLLISHKQPLDASHVLEQLTHKLLAAYRSNASAGWHWFEPVVSYSNGLLPWGLLSAYEVIGDQEILDVAKESLDFLIGLSTSAVGHIRPIGNRGWCTPASRAQWDQQPVDVMKLLLAAKKAYELIGEHGYVLIVHKCHDWFYGANDAGVPLASHAEGSCFDGISEKGVNLNQGAESTICYLIAEALYQKIQKN